MYYLAMITIAQAVEQTIANSPLYGEAILQEIVNYSAIARKIMPLVEDVLLEPVTEGAVTIALKRHAAELRKRHPIRTGADAIHNISLRSGLVICIYHNSPSLQYVHQKMITLATEQDAFLQFAQGSRESSFVISESCVVALKKFASQEKLVAEYPGLSAISVRMPPEVMDIPGIFAPFVQALAWKNISVYQIVSHFTEITFVVSDNDADAAFAVVKSVTK